MPTELNTTPQLKEPSKPNKLTGRDVFLMLVGFFGLMTVANIFLVYHALQSWTGLEVASSYSASQSYQQQLDAAAEQAALGWHVTSSVGRDDNGNIIVTAHIEDDSGYGLSDAEVAGVLVRPTQTAMDTELEFHPVGTSGDFVALVEDLTPGAWDLRLEVSDSNGNQFRSRNRLLIDASLTKASLEIPATE